jgi:hypothetical protein
MDNLEGLKKAPTIKPSSKLGFGRWKKEYIIYRCVWYYYL